MTKRMGLLHALTILLALPALVVAQDATNTPDPDDALLDAPAPSVGQDEPPETPEMTEATLEADETAKATDDAASVDELPEPTAAPTTPAQPAEPPGSARQIAIGEEVTSSLSAESPARLFAFSGSEGDIISISMMSDEVDSYLRLGDAQGNQLLADDDSGSGLDARIGPVQLPGDASFVIVASSFDNVLSEGAEVETGEFTLIIETWEPEDITVPAQVTGEMPADAPLLLYRFEADQGSILSISMDSEDFDTFLSVSQASNPAGVSVTDDDSGPDRNALIIPFIVPQSGEYFITASSYDGGAEGEFTLNVAPVVPASIEAGTPIETAINRRQPVLVYEFEGAAGDTIGVTVESPTELDSTLTIIGPDGAQVAFNDDLVGRNPGVENLQLPADGMYLLVVQPFLQGTEGDITVTLSGT